MNVPKDINLNFVSSMTIEQTFDRTADSLRLITKDDIQVHFKLTENSKGMYARRLNRYSHHSFEEPGADEHTVFASASPVITEPDAARRSERFWTEVRPQEAVRKNPKTVKELMKDLRSVPIFYYTEKAISILFSGYMATAKDPQDSKFEFGPMNSSFGEYPIRCLSCPTPTSRTPSSPRPTPT